VALPLIGVAVAIVVANLSSDQAWPVAAFLLIGLIVLVVPTDAWQKVLSSVESAQLGPLSFGLRQQVEAAAEIAPPSDKGEGVVAELQEEAESVFDLRLQLEWKLAFIAKHLLEGSDGVTFANIGSLWFDGYLTDSEARTAIGIMTARDEELRLLPEAERRKFIADAQTFLNGLRAAVFWGRVRRELQGRGSADGVDLFLERVRGTDGRDDLLAGDGEEEVRVIPVLSINESSDKLDEALEPIEKGTLPRPRTRRQIIVVPDSSETKVPQEPAAPVVPLSELRRELQAA